VLSAIRYSSICSLKWMNSSTTKFESGRAIRWSKSRSNWPDFATWWRFSLQLSLWRPCIRLQSLKLFMLELHVLQKCIHEHSEPLSSLFYLFSPGHFINVTSTDMFQNKTAYFFQSDDIILPVSLNLISQAVVCKGYSFLLGRKHCQLNLCFSPQSC
jgi:hypothetical protein